MNKDSLSWGRLAAVDLELVKEKASSGNNEIEDDKLPNLNDLIKVRKDFLTEYQDSKYANRYENFVRKNLFNGTKLF